MGTYRDHDPLAAFLTEQQSHVLDCIMQFASGEGAARLTEARRRLHALAEAEAEVLYPAFSRVNLKLESEHLLEDSRGNRAEQMAALDVLAHKRAPRLRKLAAVELCDRIHHHGVQHASQLIPVLASQLPRPLYRSIVAAFTARHERVAAQDRPESTATPTPTRATSDRRGAGSAQSTRSRSIRAPVVK
jgi:hypothetical protein